MQHIQGDLLKRPAGINVIIHQANINGKMGAGIARQIADQFPTVAAVDHQYWVAGAALLGHFSQVRLIDGSIVVNLYGQSIRKFSSAGIPTDYNAVVKSFEAITEWLYKNPCSYDYVIGVPKLMGCALGGGDWNIYSAIIEATIGQKYPVVCVEWRTEKPEPVF